MRLCFQIELTTNVILTKKILDIKIKKAKTTNKEKEKLVTECQAIKQVKRQDMTGSPVHGVKFRNILLSFRIQIHILIFTKNCLKFDISGYFLKYWKFHRSLLQKLARLMKRYLMRSIVKCC